MKPKKFFSCQMIYKAKRGKIYDPENRKYNCYRPAMSNSYTIFDCWVCDSNGNVHPGYSDSPVPVHADNLGSIVGEYDAD